MVEGLATGTYLITPYDTWQGEYLDAYEVTCPDGGPCTLALPDLLADMAFRIRTKVVPLEIPVKKKKSPQWRFLQNDHVTVSSRSSPGCCEHIMSRR